MHDSFTVTTRPKCGKPRNYDRVAAFTICYVISMFLNTLLFLTTNHDNLKNNEKDDAYYTNNAK